MLRCSPDTQVLGAIVLSIFGTSRLEDLQPYFDKYGLKQYDPDKYYPIEPLFKLVNEIVEDRKGLDSMFDLVSMGISNGTSIPLPPEIDTMEKWLMIWGKRHPVLYHGTDIGYVKCEKNSDSNFTVRVRWPWMDDIAYGTIYGMCKRFLPPDSEFVVEYDGTVPRADEGADETVLHIRW